MAKKELQLLVAEQKVLNKIYAIRGEWRRVLSLLNTHHKPNTIYIIDTERF